MTSNIEVMSLLSATRRQQAAPTCEANAVIPVRHGNHYDYTYASMEEARRHFLVAASAWLTTRPDPQDVQDELAVAIGALRAMGVLLAETPNA
jgi:hypothetical protein